MENMDFKKETVCVVFDINAILFTVSLNLYGRRNF